MKKCVIVGNGMVGHRLCAKLRERAGSDALEITVFGEEPRPAYDRVRLTSALESGDAAHLVLGEDGFHADHGVELRPPEGSGRPRSKS